MRSIFTTTPTHFTLVIAPLHGAEKPPVPDFTQSGAKDEMHEWTLGPTCARGWVWARQILITEVAAGSPADGVVQKGDV